MSLKVELLTGEYITTGFDNGDVTRVLFGDLPPISTEQFCEYASATIIDALPRLDRRGVEDVRLSVECARRKLVGLPLRDTANWSDGYDGIGESLRKLYEVFGSVDEELTIDDHRALSLAYEGLGMSKQAAVGNLITYYDENPFVFDGRDVLVGGRYTVPLEWFASFAAEYITGGISGWGQDLGIPIDAELAIVRLEIALSELPS